MRSDNALHAYKPLLPAVKTGQPQIQRSFSAFSQSHQDAEIEMQSYTKGLIRTNINFKLLYIHRYEL